MGKLFKLALEEAVVEEPSIVENVPVEEAVQNAEELAKTDSEIQQDIAAVEELMEEKAKLEDQAVTNDELLSNPDAVVTATDVEVSEETRTEVQYSLGYTSSMGKIRLSQESIANDVRSNPRKYLAISNEDIKDTIKKIWEKIKAFFKKIWNKVKQFISKLGIFQKIEKQKINKLKEEASELAKNPEAKSVKVKLGELDKSGNISQETRLEGSYIDSLYTACPYLVLAFGDRAELSRILDPKVYAKSLEAIRYAFNALLGRIEEVSKVDLREKNAIMSDFLNELNANLPFSNAVRNKSTFDTVMDALEGVNKEDWKTSPSAIYSIRGNTANCLVLDEKNDFGTFKIKGFGFLPLNRLGNKDAGYLEKIYNIEFDKNTVENWLYELDKTATHWKLIEKAAAQHERLIAEMDSVVNKLGDENTSIVRDCIVNETKSLASPEVVAAYISDIKRFREEMIYVLKDVLNCLKKSTRAI